MEVMTEHTVMTRRGLAVGGLFAALALSCTSLTAGNAAVPEPAHHSSGSLSPATSATPASPSRHHHPRTRSGLLHPKHKFFGISVSGAPYNLAPFHSVGQKVHKTPDVLSYFLDWTHQVNIQANRQVCHAGAVPNLTWESWNWNIKTNGTTAFSQPQYAPRRIAAGAYDHFIRQQAKRIKQIHCPVLLRFDHEMNGYWYPWGVRSAGMHNKAHDYVRMWRHVWRVFRSVHAHNVIWDWSPNYLGQNGKDQLGALYPGKKYVDLVGIDGYLLHAGDSPGKIFGPIMHRLHQIAPHRPWYVAETGAPADGQQPARIRALVHKVAKTKRLVGFIYFDEPGSRANWTFSNRPSSVAAFRKAIHGRKFS
jgi:mannan endo-1,4-beta-mannosidase